MTNHQTNVLEFNTKAGLVHPDVPTVPNKKELLNRAKLIAEEFFEVIDAMGIAITVETTVSVQGGVVGAGRTIVAASRVDYRTVTIDYDKYHHRLVNLPHLAKELADLHVVTTGAACVCGIDMEPVQEAVDQNNLQKFGPGSHVNADGKLVKSPNHPKPDINSILQQQGYKE